MWDNCFACRHEVEVTLSQANPLQYSYSSIINACKLLRDTTAVKFTTTHLTMGIDLFKLELQPIDLQIEEEIGE